MPNLPLENRLEILTAAARYDVSCASSGSARRNTGGVGSAASCGICHSWTADGRCVSLLKILLSNDCIYDCAYCVNRRSNDTPRAAFTPAEVAELTIGFYRRNYIEGLFLSTGIVRDPDYTTELLVETVRLLREEYRFNGYIHLKGIPGSDPLLLERAGLYVDRMSVNIEMPTRESLALLAPQKSREAVVAPIRTVGELISRYRDERKTLRSTPRFVPAGQSTQLVIGATPESDLQIVRLSENLYRKLALKRVYYSAYVAVNRDGRLPSLAGAPPLLREHRLYQADWLLRYYGFSADEILEEESPNLDTAVDPKTAWALRHYALFPVEVNLADYEVLVRVPGIGVRSARRIVIARRHARLGFDELKKLGVVLKRARYFVTADGRGEGAGIDAARVRLRLTAPTERKPVQLPLFGEAPALPSAVTGEF